MYSLERGAASWRSSWKIDAGSGNGASPGERGGVWKMKKKVGRHQAGRMGGALWRTGSLVEEAGRNTGRTAVSAEGRTEEKHLLTPLSASLVGTPPISVPAIALRGPCVKSYPL